MRLVEAQIINVLGEGFSVCIVSEQFVQTMTTDSKETHHIRTHEVDVCINSLVSDGVIDEFEKF